MDKKFLLILFVCICSVFGYDFSYCQKRYKELSLKVKKNIYATPIFYKNKTYFILYSKEPLKDKSIIRSDPFIGLYLIAAKKEVQGYLLRDIDRIAMQIPIGVIGFNWILQTQIKKNQQDYLEFAKLGQEVMQSNLVVGNICYQIYGVTTGDGGFITKPYIERFLNQDKPYYGDIGARMQDNIIKQIDPFFPNNPFLPDDKIIQIGAKKTPKSSNLSWIISNLEQGKQIEILVERNEKHKRNIKKLQVIVRPRYGGFLLQDSFFESQKIGINKDLEITKVNDLLRNGLEKLNVGDKIIWIARVNPKELKGDIFDNLREVLMRAYLRYGYIEFLIDRNGFQFNLKVYPR